MNAVKWKEHNLTVWRLTEMFSLLPSLCYWNIPKCQRSSWTSAHHYDYCGTKTANKTLTCWCLCLREACTTFINTKTYTWHITRSAVWADLCYWADDLTVSGDWCGVTVILLQWEASKEHAEWRRRDTARGGGGGGRNFSLTFYKLLFTTQSLCSYRESSPALRGSVWWSQTPALYVAATRRVFLSDAAWPAVFWREHSMKWALKTPGWTSWLLVINNTKSKCSCE